MRPRRYLALGDNLSLDASTGVEGGGAASQVASRLRDFGWQHESLCSDGCRMAAVPVDERADLLTLTVGGSDLFERQERWLENSLDGFAAEHQALLAALRTVNADAILLVSNVVRPAGIDAELSGLLEEANARIAASCAAHHAILVDAHAAFAGREALLLVDGLEPSLAGASVLATVFLTHISRLGLLGP
jgi:hypothetical protein